MGGASSYWAILAISGFLTAIWSASKVSKLAGVSSIVLEISIGAALGPRVLGLMPDVYAVAFKEKVTDCTEKRYYDVDKSKQIPAAELCTLSAFNDHDDRCHLPSSATCLVGHADPALVVSEACIEQVCKGDVLTAKATQPDIFTLIGHTGVALMIFESGMHFDFDMVKEVGPKASVVAVLGTFLPLLSGCLMVWAFGHDAYPDGVAAGTALAPTSVGIALKLLNEANALNKNFGQTIMTAAFVDDILSLILFNVLFAVSSGHISFMTFLPSIIGIIFMTVACIAAMKFWPPVIQTIMDRFGGFTAARGSRADLSKTGLSQSDELLFLIMFVLLVVYATLTHLMGTHLWGCFIAGMSFSKVDKAHHVWKRQTKRMTTWMLRIFFACTVAFSIPVDKLLNITAFWQGSLLGIGPCILTKVLCAFFMGKPRFVIGWAMVGRAEFAYLIAQMAMAGDMLSPEVFAMVIWALLYATIFAPFIFRTVLAKYMKLYEPIEEEGSEADSEEEAKPAEGEKPQTAAALNIKNLVAKAADKDVVVDAEKHVVVECGPPEPSKPDVRNLSMNGGWPEADDSDEEKAEEKAPAEVLPADEAVAVCSI